MTNLVRPVLAIVAASAVAAALVAAQPPSPPPRDLAQPVLIELFQSQGCSSCPPALGVLAEEASRHDIVALNFAVTYWDQLGWKDIYAKPEFTARQWDYARAGGRSNVATPQLIVAGRQAVLGSRKNEVDRAINAARRADGPSLSASPGHLLVGKASARGAATVWVADYDPRTIAVPISAGENGGRTLPHRNIVKRLTAIGVWRGGAAKFPLPPIAPGLVRAAFVQVGKGGPVIAARTL
ncbi:MAG: DUF1223 domain-containing protein [Sphingomicrobium sp.]